MLSKYLRRADTSLLNLTSRFATKLNISDTASMLLPYFRDADTSLLNLTNRFNTKLNISDTTLMLSKYLRRADTSLLNLTSRFATKLNISDTASMLTNYLRSGVSASTYQTKLNGTGFVKASGTNITYDNSSYLRTGLADSTYLKLTGGELSNNLGVIGNISFGSKSVYSGQYTRYLQSSETSPYRDLFIGSLGTLGTWAGRMHFQTSYNTEAPTTAMTINEFGNINMNGTLGVTGATTLSSTLSVTGAVTLSTTTATPTSLLGKDGSNVVGTVTTVAQTGLMTRGETTATTGSPSAVFTVTHGLGSNPSAVIITSAGIGGGDKIIFEVYTKSDTTFSVQAWNLDGTEASSKSVKIYWLAIK
jgi:hypothetical protein